MKKMKNFVLGILVGALLVSVPVLADDIWEKIDVVRNKIAVVVDGEKINADNFLFNDTTYVPIRAVAEKLGVSVAYKDGVAYIGDSFGAEFGGDEILLSNGYKVTTNEINDYIALYRKSEQAQGQSESKIKEAAEDYLARDRALIEIAKENGIVAGEEFFNNFNNIMAYVNLTYGGEEGAKKAMADAGYTYEMYKRYQEIEYLYARLLHNGEFAVSEDEINTYYKNNKSLFKYDGVQAKHILISTLDENGKEITDSAKLKELENKAKDVYKQAKSGKDFDELIKEYGEDPGMLQNPDGYTFTKGEMVKEFEDMAFSMRTGAISAPVKTQYGWHIIKKIKAIDVLPINDDMKTKIANTVSADKIDAAINKRIK